jgi:hypothetical protein
MMYNAGRPCAGLRGARLRPRRQWQAMTAAGSSAQHTIGTQTPHLLFGLAVGSRSGSRSARCGDVGVVIRAGLPARRATARRACGGRAEPGTPTG